jgi:GNAT superfamily N-acetyltransferase
MVAYHAWLAAPPPAFARLWYAMLDECGLLGSGVVRDWEERLSEHFRRQMEAGNLQWFVAEDGDEIVGTAAAILAHEGSYIFNDRSATLAGIYVVPAYRKRGIARELTLRALDWCRQQGCVSVRLRASAAGRPLYESLGFVTGDEMVLDLR